MPPHDAIPRAKSAALKALALDDSLAEAHSSLAYAKLNYDWDWKGAEADFRRALTLNPGSAEAHHWYSQLYKLCHHGPSRRKGRPDYHE